MIITDLPVEGMVKFFKYARERYNIFIRREAGESPPWTLDPVLAEWRFCNIFREDDTTTVWFRKNIRDPMKDNPMVLSATAAFRWFNRISTGELIKDVLLQEGWNGQKVRKILKGVNPVITGSYMVRSKPGMSKLEGICQSMDAFHKSVMDPKCFEWFHRGHWSSQEEMWEALIQLYDVGPFTGYEIVTDLKHTYMLRGADDLMTWANPGPGADRGLRRIAHQDITKSLGHSRTSVPGVELLNDLMWILLTRSQTDTFWWPSEWPKWDMRTVEHTLCEFDKYERARLGEGRIKQKFKGGKS